MSGTIKTIESSMEKLGSSMTKIGGAMSLAVTAPLTAFSKKALSAGMDFTAQMSIVEAISGATVEQMEALNAEALKMGSTTQFTATEAGEALEYMAMAGWKTDEMLAGLAPIMNLAAASGENLGTVSDIVTDALTAFGLKAEDAAHFSDILAVASSNANTNVSMMGETFKYVAPVAGALGYKAEDVAVAIGLMANSGIKAGQAGTALRAALSSMANPSKAAGTAMDQLGLSLTYSNGQMKPLNELIGDMRVSFSKLTEAEQAQYAAAIFGQEAMSGMLAIINASDTDIQKLTQSITECDGATDKMAKTVLDNATGDLTLFKSAVEGAQVALFKLHEDSIRKVIQSCTALVDKFNNSSDATKKFAVNVAGLLAAAGPSLVVLGKAVGPVGKIAGAFASAVGPIGLMATGFALLGFASDGVIDGIVEQISRLDGIDLEGIAANAGSIGSAMIDGIASVIKNGIGNAAKITGAISDVLRSINDKDWGSTLGDLGADLMDKILKGITQVTTTPDMSMLMVNIGKGIEESLTFVGDISGKIVGYILSPEGINSIISAGSSLASALFAGMTAGFHGLASGIGNALSSIFKEVGTNLLEAVGIDPSEFASKIDDMVSSMFGETGKAISEMTDEQMQAYGHKLVNGLGTILEQAEAWVALEAAGYGDTFAQYAEASFDTAGLTLAKALADGFNGDIEQQTYAMAALMANGMGNGLKEQYPQLWAAAAELANEGIAPSLEEACQKLGLDIPDNIAQAIGANWAVVTEELTTQGESVRVLLSDLGMDAGQILGSTLPQGVTAGIENGELVLRDAIGRVVDIASMAASQADVESQSAASGQAAMDSASQAVTDNAYKVEDSTATAEAGMEAAMLPIEANFAAMSQNAMDGMCSVTNAMSPNLAMASSNAATTAVNAAKSVMNSTAGYNIGRDVMQGMINAIRSMSGTLASAARSAVNNAIAAMRKAADAHSPSRKTLALGEDMDEGGAIGLSGGLMAAAAAQAAKDAVRAMAAEAYISDPGAGTVMTARQSARQVANETARSISEGNNSSFARDVGTAMADRLIESGALEGDVYIGEEKVGKKLTKPISKNVAKKSKYTVKGRSAREVVLA